MFFFLFACVLCMRQERPGRRPQVASLLTGGEERGAVVAVGGPRNVVRAVCDSGLGELTGETR